MFANAGNTCYLNAAMHVLLHAPQLTNYFLIHENVESSSAFVRAYGDLVRAYWSAGTVPVAGPYDRATAMFLKRHADLFPPGAQHDALEAMTRVLEDLHEGLGPFKGRSKVADGSFGSQKEWRRQNPSLITEIFGHQTVTDGRVFDHATSVHVPATCGSIREGVLRLAEPEIVGGGKIRETRFSHLPLVLFVHVQRFEDAFVECPRRMDLWGSVYSLFAVVFHRGSLHSGGHYTCGVATKDDGLLKIFDDDADPTIEKIIDGRAVYLAAYKKLNL